MVLKRPSFLPSLDELEQQAQNRSSQRGRPGSHFDHPTAKAVFLAILVITVIAHIVGGIVFLVMSG
ncbi:hypothetical protein [Spirillospora sp. NPDC048819]|uniref:hypothetical protein n=1 Tax=Spirillospora sp. NPDC048819 TaxID=3155268 RepID=UPI003403B4D1